MGNEKHKSFVQETFLRFISTRHTDNVYSDKEVDGSNGRRKVRTVGEGILYEIKM